MNMNAMMNKLQTAILHKGLPISINRSQFYSAEQKRFIPVMTLSTKVYRLNEKTGIWSDKDYEIIRTCSQPDVLECLADIYKAVSMWQ